MAYEIVSGIPAAIGGTNVAGFLEARDLKKAPPACPPFKFPFDSNCPFSLLEYASRRKYLCDRILGAINLAKRAAFSLETKPLSQDTINKFRQIFGQGPVDRWELPWAPRRTMPAGDIVAGRFRRVEKELRTRDTLYRCTTNFCARGSGASRPRPDAPSHPTETIVDDDVAWAALCKDEVGLCPRFWALRPEWQEGTILHEMLHLYFGLTCAWFQHDHKEKTRNSAYCYEAFALMIDNKVPEPIVILKCGDVLRKTTIPSIIIEPQPGDYADVARRILRKHKSKQGIVLSVVQLIPADGKAMIDTRTESGRWRPRLKNPPAHVVMPAEVYEIKWKRWKLQYVWILSNEKAVFPVGGVLFLPWENGIIFHLVTFNVGALEYRCTNAHHAETQAVRWIEEQPRPWRSRVGAIAIWNLSRKTGLGYSPCNYCCVDLARFLTDLRALPAASQARAVRASITWLTLYDKNKACGHPTDTANLQRLVDSGWKCQGPGCPSGQPLPSTTRPPAFGSVSERKRILCL